MDFEQECLNTAFWSNAYSPYSIRDKETGFRTNSLIFSQPSLRKENPAENFLANSQLKKNDLERDVSLASYFDDPGLTMVSLINERDIENMESIPITEGVPLQIDLAKALLLRRSTRSFTKDQIDFDYISTLIRVGFGVSATNEVSLSGDKKVTIPLHMAPSGGGLYPVQLFMVALNIKKIENGIYYFSPNNDKLIKFSGKDSASQVLNSYSSPKGIISTEEAGAIFLLVGSPWKSMRKYGSRGVRFMFHEAGSIAENIHLAATALGIGTVDCASFYDEEIHKILKIDGINNTFLSSIFVGIPA